MTQNKPSSQDIQVLISKWISDEILFTKYDVTKQMRHNGFWVEHSEVKSVFSNMIIPNTYKATVINTNGHPLLYHPDGTDPADYDPYEIPMFKISTKVVANSTTIKMSTPKSSDFFDNRNRFFVAAKYVRAAGFGPRTLLFITANSNCIEISNVKSNGRSVTVDCYYNIRVPKKDFEKAFVSIPSKIDIKITPNNIKIVEG